MVDLAQTIEEWKDLQSVKVDDQVKGCFAKLDRFGKKITRYLHNSIANISYSYIITYQSYECNRYFFQQRSHRFCNNLKGNYFIRMFASQGSEKY
jgi:hypothetical protein